MRFVMGLHVAPAELDSVVALERNCSKHISVVNDIYSWEKELIASKTGHAEGSALCSGVLIMANEAKLSIEGSKRVLWQMCREWEQAHVDLVAETKAAGNAHTDLEEYMKGLEYQMSGNELWSQSTKRYLEVYE